MGKYKINYEAIKEYITTQRKTYDKDYVFDPSAVQIYFSVWNGKTQVHKEIATMTNIDTCNALMAKFEDWCDKMSKETNKYITTTMELRWYKVYTNTSPYYVWNEDEVVTDMYDIIARRESELIRYNENWSDNIEKTYEVSAPMFVLPFINVTATNEEEAMDKYQQIVTETIAKTFGKVDIRPLYERDEQDAWVVKEIKND